MNFTETGILNVTAAEMGNLIRLRKGNNQGGDSEVRYDKET